VDKKILEQYIDACALAEEAETDLQKLRMRQKQMEHVIVKGSSHEFPYTVKNFHSEGIAHSVLKDPRSVEEQEKILQQRIDNAMRIKLEVEAWMLTVSPRMQRIIRYKIFDELTWGQVAARMGRKATADGIRKEFEAFMKVA